jgi:uncharacterized protein (TIGR02391 family)
MNLDTVIPNVDQLLAMTHAQLAHTVLRALHAEKAGQQRVAFGHAAQAITYHPQDVQFAGYPRDRVDEIILAVLEAWAWMDRELILVSFDFLAPAWRKLSRIGRSFLEEEDPAPLLAARQIDRTLIHPTLRGDALEAFWRGSYDVAVFTAYRDVEVAVRDAGALPATRIGVQLMADAFNPTGGPLRDANIPNAEQVAMMNLFQGAIGLFKNPNSHRYVQVDAKTAAELLILASRLLSMVDARAQQPVA